jgi:1,4-alpha-glucan branching enzyme
MELAPWQAREEDVTALAEARHPDPFAVLGLQRPPSGMPPGMVLRAFVPGAETVTAIDEAGAPIARLARHGDTPLFEAFLPQRTARFGYRLHATRAVARWTFRDAFAFAPVLGPLDDHLLVEGTHKRLYERLGAHVMTHEGVEGVHFAVWAPHARRVSVVGDFNAWDGRRHPMRKRIDSGLWEIFIPDIGEGAVYKFEILGASGELLPLKADPFGFAAELRPSTASVVARTATFRWTDAAWLAARARRDARRTPMAIYEVHLGSWRRHRDGRFYSWDEIAAQLVPYAVDLGFTHLELLPVTEHPLDASWGYQPIGLFAPTRRFGDPAGFARFIDRAHAAGLAVLADWVPAHFPTDVHGLAWFDGAALYEHPDPRRGFQPDWNTAVYDYGRPEVANVLTASALYWLDRYHLDGLRVDAVASMLYLDYSRRPGEWLPNAEGGNENRDAVSFLQHTNALAYAAHAGITMTAEESTAWSGVSQPVDAGGLGFGFKWNMGWMHDTLTYFGHEPVHRRWHHDHLTFGLLYAFSENFVLPLSHDEVVHGKGSIISRMPGDEWQKFANLRAYYAFMWGYPGKKLLFMGQEFGQRDEWNFAQELDWYLLNHVPHQGLRDCVRQLNRVYRAEPALHARDCEPEGFRWIVVDDAEQSVVAWLRSGTPGDLPVAVVCNFTPVPRERYRIGLPLACDWIEILNTDAVDYGGSGIGNLGRVSATATPSHGLPASAELVLPPLATLYLRPALGGT